VFVLRVFVPSGCLVARDSVLLGFSVRFFFLAGAMVVSAFSELDVSFDFAVSRELCKDLFAEWSKLDDSRFAVETVSGGITNLCEF